ncbi:RagB/SusD family nutrient uptake outer membrane protein [Moheibacter sediminis]|uniref:Starch-binding associating with outer membrane n=1 Tax=Moheibacter sediminis TaxID=1434700 RepID=A0A1W2CHV9_9FLAO|nr:RagB/SusD family nutrient uptake outer membrane protein [Moheibacter sediminis]SMC84462.1 Starch-binding associating with outer membrane [Moheibacter sediminis]
MKIKKIIYTLTIGAFLTLPYGCETDLETDPIYTQDSENYFNNPDDYYRGLIGAYDLLQSTYLNAILGEIASDNTVSGGESANDVIAWQQVDEMMHSSVNDQLKALWDRMFAGVQRCNLVLTNKDKIEFDGKDQIIAEVRFLRAYYHFELVKWFGGIPMKGDEQFVIGDELTIPRSSVEEVYASIEADLIFATENLSPVAPEVGRVTQGAAYALLGKAYLYQNKFQQAATALDQVITSGNYSLVQNYSTLFEFDQENGAESVFEVQYTDIEGAGFGCLQCSEGNVAVGFSGIRNYNGPLFSSGYSFNLPTAEAYDAFDEQDLRRDIAILDIEAWASETGATYGMGYKHTGYFNRKYLPRTRSEDAAGDLNLTNPNNYRSIRFADVLLMAAEAYNRGNISDATARDYLNRVRSRAFGNTNNNVTTSGSALTEAIWRERRLELIGEGHRFFDLVRTGKAVGTIAGFVAGKHELFPIPFEEIQFSNGNWQQNPNY